MDSIPSPIKFHGAKSYLAKKIISLMPSRKEWCHYVEPYFGSGAVLFAQEPEGISEVVNDLNKDLINFWKVLQGGISFASFQRLCQATPFSEAEWADANLGFQEWPDPVEEASDSVVRAWRWFIWCRQSMAGRMKNFTPISKNRTRRGMNEQASAWLSSVEGLPVVHERLKRLVILGPKEATEVIQQQDGKKTFFYCDPTYLHETRATVRDYKHEMSFEQHEELLEVLSGIEGKFLLSGYRSALYDDYSKKNGWEREDIEIPNHAASGKSKRVMIECLWRNY